jgi:MraZ protein
MLYGNHEHTLDDKGRVAIPARFREQLGELVYLTRGFDGNLIGFSAARWGALSAELERLTLSDPKARQLRRYLFGNATDSTLDKQGRIVIPPPLREAVELGAQVMIIGLGNHFEIWSQARWTDQASKLDVTGDDLAPYLASLGL